MPLAVESLNGSVPSIEAGTTRPEPAARKLGSVFIYSDSGEMYRNRGDIWEQIGGAIGDFLGSKPPTFVEADVTLAGGEQTVLADANAAPFTVTLASASGRAGYRTVIKKIDGTTNMLTIAAPTGETVEDRNYIETDTPGDAVEIESDGVEWRIVSSPTGGGGASEHAHAKLDRLPDIETSQRVVYVSPSGSDSTGDGSSANRWATIQHAVDQARSFLLPSSTTSYYKIVCATGTYDQSIVIPPNMFAAFNTAGAGGVWIASESGNRDDVLLTSTASYTVRSLGSFTLQDVTVENDTTACLIQGSAALTAFLNNCRYRRKSLSNGGNAAIESRIATVISNISLSTPGQLFEYGLYARYGSIIAKNGSQPTGSVANELVAAGGVIR